MKLQDKLILEQLDHKTESYRILTTARVPEQGWIKTVRTAMNISLRQIAARLGITPASVKEMEIRESEKTITLKKLEEAANAMGCKLVYGFVPMKGTFSDIVEKQARKIAAEIVMRTAHTMELESQGNTEERLKKAIEERTKKIMYERPRYLWD